MAKYVEYDEPAYDQGGIVISRTIRMTVEDAVRLMKLLHPGIYTSDKEALQDFVAIHWAVVKDDGPTGG